MFTCFNVVLVRSSIKGNFINLLHNLHKKVTNYGTPHKKWVPTMKRTCYFNGTYTLIKI